MPERAASGDRGPTPFPDSPAASPLSPANQPTSAPNPAAVQTVPSGAKGTRVCVLSAISAGPCDTGRRPTRAVRPSGTFNGTAGRACDFLLRHAAKQCRRGFDSSRRELARASASLRSSSYGSASHRNSATSDIARSFRLGEGCRAEVPQRGTEAGDFRKEGINDSRGGRDGHGRTWAPRCLRLVTSTFSSLSAIEELTMSVSPMT